MNDPTQEITAVIDTPRDHVEREGNRIKRRLAAMNPETERLFRINAGRGWVSNRVRHIGSAVLLADARVLQAGPDGWFDVCGWTSVPVTQEMVGTTLAVFTGEEFKRDEHDKPKGRQKTLGEILERMGGIYRIVRP